MYLPFHERYNRPNQGGVGIYEDDPGLQNEALLLICIGKPPLPTDFLTDECLIYAGLIKSMTSGSHY